MTAAVAAAAARTLGDLVIESPGAARVLDRYGIDYCCRGHRTLAEACAAARLDPARITAELDSVGGEAEGGDTWASLAPLLLIEHIVATHHRFLREELPLLEALAAKVLGVHGSRHPELDDVERLVRSLRLDIEPHLEKEERVLFPAIRALYDGRREFPFGTIVNPIRMMVYEHDRAGELLAALRSVTRGYQVPDDGCVSYRLLYERLAALEHDTHVHIHKENHRLFPAALEESKR